MSSIAVPRKSNKWILIAAASALVAAGAGFVLTRGGGEKRQEAPLPVAAAPAPAPLPAPPQAPQQVVEPKKPATVKVSLRSEPPGAVVSIGGNQVAMTPTEIDVVLPQEVHLSKMGYEDATDTITREGPWTVTMKALKPVKMGHSPKPSPAKAPPPLAVPAPPVPKPARPQIGEGLE